MVLLSISVPFCSTLLVGLLSVVMVPEPETMQSTRASVLPPSAARVPSLVVVAFSEIVPALAALASIVPWLMSVPVVPYSAVPIVPYRPVIVMPLLTVSVTLLLSDRRLFGLPSKTMLPLPAIVSNSSGLTPKPSAAPPSICTWPLTVNVPVTCSCPPLPVNTPVAPTVALDSSLPPLLVKASVPAMVLLSMSAPSCVSWLPLPVSVVSEPVPEMSASRSMSPPFTALIVPSLTKEPASKVPPLSWPSSPEMVKPAFIVTWTPLATTALLLLVSPKTTAPVLSMDVSV